MLRLRHLLLFFFGLLTIVPVALLAIWVSKNSLEREYAEVSDRHLLLAQNVGQALNVYQRDVKSVFQLAIDNSTDATRISGIERLLNTMHFRHVCFAEYATGKITGQVAPVAAPCPTRVPDKFLPVFKELAAEGEIIFSPVMEGPDNLNLLFLLHKQGDRLAIGALKTDYIVQLGKSISFGVKGHAAIVDHEGSVLSHPLDSWIAERKNITKVSAVQRMLNKETGIEQFYSPALKGDMIAGLTHVEGTGWGVMIPQPVAELEAKAADEMSGAMLIMGGTAIFVVLLSVLIACHLSVPIERLTKAADKASRDSKAGQVKVYKNLFTPIEQVKVQTAFNEMVKTISAANQEMRKLAFCDPITGLANRIAFDRKVREQLENIKSNNENANTSKISGALIFIDLDDFKSINDTMGHAAGDSLLKQVAKNLQDAISNCTDTGNQDPLANPIFARNGGDEFTMFVPFKENFKVDLDSIASSLNNAGKKPVTISGENIMINSSIGISQFPQDADDLDGLIKRADIAMYRSKQEGKNRYCIYKSEFGEKTVAEICRDVSNGIKNGDFSLHYQPKVNAKTELVEGCEALIRWEDPERGLIFPNEFIPAIEKNPATIELGEFVLRQAMRSIRKWKEEGHSMRVAVNISSFHFTSPGFVERMTEIALEEEVHPSAIEFEITEESVLSDEKRGSKTIHELQALGYTIALDDFGRGYSNLSRLSKMDFNVIKVDGPLVRRALHDKKSLVIVEAAFNMAKGLGCDVVAEGVESREEVEQMRGLACDYLQGYFYAKPMPVVDFSEWFANHNKAMDKASSRTKKMTA